MRKGNFFKWLIIPLYLLSIVNVSGQDTSKEVMKSYVIIGAFQYEENVHEWVKFARNNNLSAEYRLNHDRGIYYIYTFSSEMRQEAIDRVHEVWDIEGFSDAWVYTGDFVSPYSRVNEEPASSEAENEFVNGEEDPEDEPDIQLLETKAIETDKTPKTKEELRNEVILKEEEKISGSGDSKEAALGDYLVFFNLFNAQNSSDASGEVQIIDTERAKLIQTVNGGEYVSVIDPNNGTGRLSLIVETFGYRNSQHEINFMDPLSDTASLDIDLIGDVLVYHFPLIRYHKGDIATLYNVYFYKDAAIMRPESKYEALSLLEMMKENPNYKIRIHGHINGKSPGAIITVGEDREWFAMTDDDIEGFGSAKKLSEERALAIKNYLIDNGIDADRMEIKAWGGRRMIYDKHSSQAKKNVRVEVEILED